MVGLLRAGLIRQQAPCVRRCVRKAQGHGAGKLQRELGPEWAAALVVSLPGREGRGSGGNSSSVSLTLPSQGRDTQLSPTLYH